MKDIVISTRVTKEIHTLLQQYSYINNLPISKVLSNLCERMPKIPHQLEKLKICLK